MAVTLRRPHSSYDQVDGGRSFCWGTWVTTELRPELLRRGRSLLQACGYDTARRRERFAFRSDTATFDVALAGFPTADPTDLLMATVLLMANSNDGAAACRALACPYLLVPAGNDLELVVVKDDESRLLGSVEDVALDLLRHWLGPETALQVKVGLTQLPLFDVPVNLLAQTKQRHVERIGPIIGKALAEVANVIGGGDGPRSDKRAPVIVVRALAALVIAHRKGIAGSAAAIIDVAEKEFPSTFGWQLTAEAADRRLLRNLVDDLGSGIDFGTLSPSILTEVYETALVDAATRREMAIHYTPPGLARQILDALPVETLPPEHRTVLDPTCGSGTLLLAAYDRLRALQPKLWTDTARQDDLAARVSGRDADVFAVELAKLALLLHGQLSRNGWDVQHVDTVPATSDHSRTMVVCNPPWGAKSLGWAEQRADAFVELCVKGLAPGGLLGLVLPKSWLTTRTSQGSRQRLQDFCNVLEVWRLPGNLFASAKLPACVVVARRHGFNEPVERFLYRVHREVRGRDTAAFLTGTPAPTNLLLSSADAIGAAIPAVPTAVETRPLGDLALIRSGTQALPSQQQRGGRTPFVSRWADVNALETVTDAHPSIIGLSYPDDFAGGWGAQLIPLHKILFPAATRARRPRTAIAVPGIAFTHSLRGIAPHDQDDNGLLVGLAVLLGSAYTAANLERAGHDLNIPAGFLQELPVPADVDTIRALAQVRNDAESVRDAAVWDAFKVPSEYRDLFGAYLEPPVPAVALPRPPLRDVTRLGMVLKLDGQRIRIVVDGVTDPQGAWTTLPPRFPAALLTPGASFQVRGVDGVEDLPAGSYSLQPLDWWDPDTPRPLLPVPGLTW